MAEPEIREFLAHLAVDLEVSASTQTVALSALLFLYRDVLKQRLPYVSDIERAKTSKRLPVVFSRAEVQAVIARGGALRACPWLLHRAASRLGLTGAHAAGYYRAAALRLVAKRKLWC